MALILTRPAYNTDVATQPLTSTPLVYTLPQYTLLSLKMTVKKVLPYGQWPSPITSDSIAFGVYTITEPRASVRSNP